MESKTLDDYYQIDFSNNPGIGLFSSIISDWLKGNAAHGQMPKMSRSLCFQKITTMIKLCYFLITFLFSPFIFDSVRCTGYDFKLTFEILDANVKPLVQNYNLQLPENNDDVRPYVAYLLDQENSDKKRELEEHIEDFQREIDQLFRYIDSSDVQDYRGRLASSTFLYSNEVKNPDQLVNRLKKILSEEKRYAKVLFVFSDAQDLQLPQNFEIQATRSCKVKYLKSLTTIASPSLQFQGILVREDFLRWIHHPDTKSNQLAWERQSYETLSQISTPLVDPDELDKNIALESMWEVLHVLQEPLVLFIINLSDESKKNRLFLRRYRVFIDAVKNEMPLGDAKSVLHNQPLLDVVRSYRNFLGSDFVYLWGHVGSAFSVKNQESLQAQYHVNSLSFHPKKVSSENFTDPTAVTNTLSNVPRFYKAMTFFLVDSQQALPSRIDVEHKDDKNQIISINSRLCRVWIVDVERRKLALYLNDDFLEAILLERPDLPALLENLVPSVSLIPPEPDTKEDLKEPEVKRIKKIKIIKTPKSIFQENKDEPVVKKRDYITIALFVTGFLLLAASLIISVAYLRNWNSSESNHQKEYKDSL